MTTILTPMQKYVCIYYERESQKKRLVSTSRFFSYICLRQVILLRSYIRLTPSDIVLRTVERQINITETEGFNNTFDNSKITLHRRWNIT